MKRSGRRMAVVAGITAALLCGGVPPAAAADPAEGSTESGSTAPAAGAGRQHDRRVRGPAPESPRTAGTGVVHRPRGLDGGEYPPCDHPWIVPVPRPDADDFNRGGLMGDELVWPEPTPPVASPPTGLRVRRVLTPDEAAPPPGPAVPTRLSVVLPPPGTPAVVAPAGPPPAQSPALPPPATPATAVVPFDGIAPQPDAYRQGYPDYLRAATRREILGLALAGLAGLIAVAGLGGVVGYRQARAGFAVRAAGSARFLP